MSIDGVTCLVGTLYLFYLLLKVVGMVVNVLKASLFGGTLDFTKFGEWAVVTGCTDGIGKAYAKQLASKGLNIVLMSRSIEKLEAVASEIKNEYKVQTKIVQIDFSGGYEIYDSIPKELEGLEIGVLVNNVGCSLAHPEYFCDVSIEMTWRLINVNMMAMTMLTRHILPAMVERRKGVVINVGSFSSETFTPLGSEYAATKSYCDKFSANLLLEYADKGIIVQSVKPLIVATKMTRLRKSSLFSPFPDDFVRAVLKKVGTNEECCGYWPHELQGLIVKILPVWVMKKLNAYSLKQIRDMALRKKKAKSS